MDPVLYKAATSSSIDLFTEKKDDPNFFLQETLEKNSALHLAAKFKQKQFAEKIIDLHPQLLYQANSKGDTPLHIAASVGCLEIAELIIASHLNTESSDVEANKDLLTMQNLEEDTALHNAVRNDHFEIVKLLTDKDEELASKQKEKIEVAANIINANGDSPLFLAVDGRHFTIARYILDEVPDCSYRGRNQMNALHAAILRDHKLESFGSCKIFYLAVLEKMSSLRIPAREGFTFMEAFIQKFPSAIKESDKFGWTPLHYAAFRGNTIAVELLLKNNDEQMPAHTYVYHKDEEGLSAFHIAAKKGRVQVMKRLTETFPDICESVDMRGRTALHVAVENGRADTVQYVLKTPSLEGLINVQDKKGNTALHLAAVHGRYEIVNNLSDNPRVEKKVMNKEGFTVIEIIVSKMDIFDLEKSRIARKLKQAGSSSLEGILRRKNKEKENVEMKERDHIESMKDRADEKEREGMVVKNLSLDTKRKRKEDEELIKFNFFKDLASTQILIATIIATVTFAAGFTMPGGYKSDQGMAVLSRKTAFQSFLISDTIAFCFSTISMVFHFYASLFQTNRHTFIFLIRSAVQFTLCSVFATVIAFISGTNVVLVGSSGLAIANIVIGCYCFPLFYVMMYPKGKI